MNSQELHAWLAEADLCDDVELLEGMSKKVRRWKRRAQKNGGVPFLLAQLDARVGARIRYLNTIPYPEALGSTNWEGP